jgi:hypothetical protein
LPVATNLGEIGQLQSHTQTDLSQFGMIVLHELYNLFALLGCEIVVLEQITLAEDLADAEYLVTGSIQGKIQEVTATLEGLQVILQFLGFKVIKLQVGDKDH